MRTMPYLPRGTGRSGAPLRAFHGTSVGPASVFCGLPFEAHAGRAGLPYARRRGGRSEVGPRVVPASASRRASREKWWRRRESNPVRKTSHEWPYARVPEIVRERPPPGLLALTFSPFGLDPSKAVRLPPQVQSVLTFDPATRRSRGNARHIRPREPWARSRFCLVSFLRGLVTNHGAHHTRSLPRRNKFAPKRRTA